MSVRCLEQPLNSSCVLRPTVQTRLFSPYLALINRVSGVPIAKTSCLPQNTARQQERDGAIDALVERRDLERVGFGFLHSVFGICDRFYKVNQCAAHFGIFNAGKGAIELQTVWRLQYRFDRGLFGRGGAILLRACGPFGQGIEEKHRCHTQNFGNLGKPAGGHAVRALFVFLNLLKGQSQISPKFFLAHAKQDAPHADAAAYVDVNWMRLSGHLDILPPRLLGPIIEGFSRCIVLGIHSVSQSQTSYNTYRLLRDITFGCCYPNFTSKAHQVQLRMSILGAQDEKSGVPISEFADFLSLITRDATSPGGSRCQEGRE